MLWWVWLNALCFAYVLPEGEGGGISNALLICNLHKKRLTVLGEGKIEDLKGESTLISFW